jgi:uncharacterized protein YdiU (UPF0061 family)
MAISGETIDYGPCAFMNAYDPGTVFSAIDLHGRYSYGNQPRIARWNLARLAEALLPLLDPDPEDATAVAMDVLDGFTARFEGYWLAGMRTKLGLRTDEVDDAGLIRSLLDWMQESRADFTTTFRDLSDGLPAGDRYQDADFQEWYARWQERLGREGRSLASANAAMRPVNPAVIPRNHRVEEALSAAEDRDDMAPMHRLLTALASPYEARAELAEYREPPADECGYRTFCGT